MRFLLLFHVVASVSLAGLVAWLFGAQAAQSTFAGAMFTLLNLGFLVVTWPRILAKKQVALAVAAIVFKFALLGGILYLVTASRSISLGWFAVGFGLVVPSVLATAIIPKSHEEVSV
jgi:Zn-dependent protease with chaperone function